MRVLMIAALLLAATVDGWAGSVSLSGVVQPLRDKTQKIIKACGSRIISTVRYTRIAGGGGRISMHASGRAVDIEGNPRCIYAHLKGWPGGYSTDYAAVRHVHISYGGFEHGKRFRHYTGRRVKPTALRWANR